MWSDPHSIGWVALIQVFFVTYREHFHFKHHPHSIQSRMLQTSVSPYRSSTKLIQFDHAKFSVSISSEDDISREFFEINSKYVFKKKSPLKT